MRSKSPKVQRSQGLRYFKVTFKYELDSKEGPFCLLWNITGTGNDLARAMGYGSGSDSSADIEQFLTKLGGNIINYQYTTKI